MKFAELLRKEHVLVASPLVDKEAAIRALLGQLVATGTIADLEPAMELVMEREREYPTGIGSHVALPHTNCLQVKEAIVALGTFPQGIDFGADDGAATLLVLLLSPQGNSGGHLKLLARISRMARHNLAQRLLACSTADDVIHEVEKVEQDFLELLMDKRLLLIVLNKEELLDDLIQGLLEVDVRGATILDSVGMGRILSQDLPIFAGLKGLLSGNRPHNKTILTAVDSDQEPKVVELFEEVVGPLSVPGNGLILALPLLSVYGMGSR